MCYRNYDKEEDNEIERHHNDNDSVVKLLVKKNIHRQIRILSDTSNKIFFDISRHEVTSHLSTIFDYFFLL